MANVSSSCISLSLLVHFFFFYFSVPFCVYLFIITIISSLRKGNAVKPLKTLLRIATNTFSLDQESRELPYS